MQREADEARQREVRAGARPIDGTRVKPAQPRITQADLDAVQGRLEAAESAKAREVRPTLYYIGLVQ
jgi:phosphatidylserine decarboxylase